MQAVQEIFMMLFFLMIEARMVRSTMGVVVRFAVNTMKVSQGIDIIIFLP